MSLDFAIKDFYRKKKQTFPYLFAISSLTSLAIFLIHFSISFNLNNFINQSGSYANPFFFSGAVNLTYTQYNMIILLIVFIFSVVIITLITTSFINSKKKDVSIMKALGTLPERLYSFYMTESLILFLLGFIIGYVLGVISYIIVIISIDLYGIAISFYFDFIFSSILFAICLFSVFLISGLQLRKIGRKNVIQTFSDDIQYDYNALQRVKTIPKMLSSLGLNIKYAISNIMRKKKKFFHYFITFFIISLLIFTLGLSALVLNNSSETWINKSQGENIIVIGHNDVVNNYTSMYEMYSNPNIFVDKNDIQFTNEEYLFNWTQIEEIGNIPEIEEIDQRLIRFCDILEKSITIITPAEGTSPGTYQTFGKDRSGNFPIIGINSTNIIQDFEIEGEFFTEADADINITIADGLAYNYFDYALVQKINFPILGEQFGIRGIVIDSFYSGHSVYIDIDVFRDMLNITNNSVNLILLKTNYNCYNSIKDQLNMILSDNLGDNFISMELNDVFSRNLILIRTLNIYSLILIILTFIVSLFSFYDLQKGDLTEKLKDLMIMRAIGSKIRNIRRILFLEGMLALIPSLISSLAGGMIISSLFLTDRVYLPPLYIPFLLIGILLTLFIALNYVILVPITKNLKKLSFKDITLF